MTYVSGSEFWWRQWVANKIKVRLGVAKAAARHTIADTVYNQSKTCTSGNTLCKMPNNEDEERHHRARPIMQHLEEEEVGGRHRFVTSRGMHFKKEPQQPLYLAQLTQQNKGVIRSRYHRVQAVSLAIRWLPLLQTDRDWRAQTHSVWDREPFIPSVTFKASISQNCMAYLQSLLIGPAKQK